MDFREELNKMMKEKNVIDNTNELRLFKNSKLIKDDINKLLVLKEKYQDPDILHLESMIECYYLSNNYTDIYNKIRKDEINIDILWMALQVLEDIENGVVDKHEGSVKFGTLLKEIYIDSALKKAEKLQKEHPELAEYKKTEVSWRDFRKK
jgi:hypothetical protein